MSYFYNKKKELSFMSISLISERPHVPQRFRVLGLFVHRHAARIAVAGLASFTLLFALGCASTAAPAAPDRAQWPTLVKARAEARWKLIASDNYEAAMQYFTVASAKGYNASMLSNVWKPLRPTGAIASDVSCDGEVCSATMNTSISVKLPRVGFRQQTVPLVERWVLENGEFRLIRN
jgi:hypothetical protein